jgi:hypothetical protein
MLKISDTALIVNLIGRPALPRRPEPWIQACSLFLPTLLFFQVSQHWYLDFLLHHIDIRGEIFQDPIFSTISMP